MESQSNGMQGLLGAHQLLRLLGSQSASTHANQVIAFVIPWLVLTRTGSAVSAIAMGLIALGVLLFPFMKYLDEKIGSEDVHEPTQSEA